VDNESNNNKKIESSKEVFYYLVRNFPVVKTHLPNKEYLKLEGCPFFLHESKKRMKNYLFEKLENLTTEDNKKEVYMTIKNYIDQTRKINHIQ
jgi:sugar diacid utilization regulator